MAEDDDRVSAPTELLREYAETHDRNVRNQIIEQMMPFAHRLAFEFANKSEPIDDLRQVALIGLLKSVERFDPDHGSDFLSFASVTIRGEIKRHFRDKTWTIRIPRRLQELHLELQQVRAELTASLNRAPTVHELAEALKVSDELILETIEAQSAYQTDSLDAPLKADSTVTKLDSIGAADPQLNKFERDETIASLLEVLDERDRKIIELRYYKDMTQAEIAEVIDVSQMHVSRLLERATAILRSEYRKIDTT